MSNWLPPAMMAVGRGSADSACRAAASPCSVEKEPGRYDRLHRLRAPRQDGAHGLHPLAPGQHCAGDPVMSAIRR